MWIDTDDVSLKLVSPSAGAACKIPKIMGLHWVPHTLTRPLQDDRAAGKIHALNKRGGANQKANLSGAEQPFDFKPDERWHVAVVKGDAAFDQRCKPIVWMNALADQVRQLAEFGIRDFEGWPQLVYKVSDNLRFGGSIDVNECASAFAGCRCNERQAFSRAAWRA
jgi:hypothetical protein